MVKVKSMISTKGNAVPNQFILWNDEDIYFQSYKSIIARVQGYEGVYPVIVLASSQDVQFLLQSPNFLGLRLLPYTND